MKKFAIALIILALCGFSIYLHTNNQTNRVLEVVSSDKIAVDFNKNNTFDENELVCVSGIEFFGEKPSETQLKTADKLGMNAEDIAVVAYLTKTFTKDLLEGEKVKVIFTKNSSKDCRHGNIYISNINYTKKFNNSPFALKDNQPLNLKLFKSALQKARNSNYRILNLNSNKFHHLDCEWGQNAQDTLILPRRQLPKGFVPCKICNKKPTKPTLSAKPLIRTLKTGSVKVFVTDLTVKLKPDTKCSTDVCREVLKHINLAKNSIDIAIYGYTRVDGIENALKNAKKRNVKVRLVYDVDSKGQNIYPDTFLLAKLIENSRGDYSAGGARNPIMHNKFFIFDNQIVITGSANLSPTDMSGYNSNISVMFDSKEIAKVFANEFEQMFSGKFHNQKSKFGTKTKFLMGKTASTVYFSPQDNAIKQAVIPEINKAKKYIYMPVFLITHKELVESLIRAKQRGIDVRVIVDAVNAMNKSSKHQMLRQNGVSVKVENYAGKMHAKSIIIDDRIAIIGSMNFSNSGETKNDENLVVIESAEVSQFCREFFEYLWLKIPDKWLKFNPRAESLDSIGSCTDGVDNNFDENIDSQDLGCKPR